MALLDSWERRLGIAEWEPQAMTICIAAACEHGRTLVVEADREIGIGFTSAEFPDGKWHFMYTDWYIGIAGNVSHSTDVMAEARKLEPKTKSVAEVQEALQTAYRRARLAKAEAEFLANRGWTLNEFKEFGSTRLPTTTYAGIDARISVYDFNADIILAGFGEYWGSAIGLSILTIKNPGVCVDHSKIGFWWVGSGSTPAQMSLFAREYSWTFSPEKAAYCVLEAKIAAQHASGVGPTTDVYLIRKGAQPIQLQRSTLDTLAGTWKKLSPKKYTDKHDAAVANANEFQALRKL